MSTGTKIIQDALSQIGAHSAIRPASPESIDMGKDMLNSMLLRWFEDDIDIGVVPLEAVGDELSEPLGFRNTIIFNLAIELQPLFPSARISAELRSNANKTYNLLLAKAQKIEIPKPQVAETLPIGQGNKYVEKTFFSNGDKLG